MKLVNRHLMDFIEKNGQVVEIYLQPGSFSLLLIPFAILAGLWCGLYWTAIMLGYVFWWFSFMSDCSISCFDAAIKERMGKEWHR